MPASSKTRLRRTLIGIALIILLLLLVVVWNSSPMRQARAISRIRSGYGAPSVSSDSSRIPPPLRHTFWKYFAWLYAINCSQVNQRKHYGPHDPPMPPFDDDWLLRILPDVQQLQDLERLTLSDTAVTDAGLENLSNLEGLRALDLSNTAITDAAISEIAAIAALEEVDLSDTNVTANGLDQLQQSRPDVVVREHDFSDHVPPRMP